MEIYIMPFEGGQSKRLTYHPSKCTVVGWLPNKNKVLFNGTLQAANPRQEDIFSISINGGNWENLGIGICFITFV